jgi:hypothetical protein
MSLLCGPIHQLAKKQHRLQIGDALDIGLAGYPANLKAGYRISGKAGYRISGKAGYRISGKAGYRISGKAGYGISGKAGYRISGRVSCSTKRILVKYNIPAIS